MDDAPTTAQFPQQLKAIEAETKALGFTMPGTRKTGALLAALAAAKPGGRLLEIGTGTGLSTAWLLKGMDAAAHLTSIDNDAKLVRVARDHLGGDHRLTLEVVDGAAWLIDAQQAGRGPIDLIFADAMPGKYERFEEAWALLAPGGLYVADDMLPQPNWPDGHVPRVEAFLVDMDARADAQVLRQAWDTGLLIAVKTEKRNPRHAPL